MFHKQEIDEIISQAKDAKEERWQKIEQFKGTDDTLSNEVHEQGITTDDPSALSSSETTAAKPRVYFPTSMLTPEQVFFGTL